MCRPVSLEHSQQMRTSSRAAQLPSALQSCWLPGVTTAPVSTLHAVRATHQDSHMMHHGIAVTACTHHCCRRGKRQLNVNASEQSQIGRSILEHAVRQAAASLIRTAGRGGQGRAAVRARRQRQPVGCPAARPDAAPWGAAPDRHRRVAQLLLALIQGHFCRHLGHSCGRLGPCGRCFFTYNPGRGEVWALVG